MPLIQLDNTVQSSQVEEANGPPEYAATANTAGQGKN